ADELDDLRSRVATLETGAEAQHANVEQALDAIQHDLASAGAAARQAEHDEELIVRLREADQHWAAVFQRMNEEQILVLNQFMGRLSGIQSDLVEQRDRMRG